MYIDVKIAVPSPLSSVPCNTPLSPVLVAVVMGKCDDLDTEFDTAVMIL